MREDVRIALSEALLDAAASASPGRMLTIPEAAIEALFDTARKPGIETPPDYLTGETIRHMRRAVGWSQARLAERISSTQQTVQRMETGTTPHSRSLWVAYKALRAELRDHTTS